MWGGGGDRETPSVGGRSCNNRFKRVMRETLPLTFEGRCSWSQTGLPTPATGTCTMGLQPEQVRRRTIGRIARVGQYCARGCSPIGWIPTRRGKGCCRPTPCLAQGKSRDVGRSRPMGPRSRKCLFYSNLNAQCGLDARAKASWKGKN